VAKYFPLAKRSGVGSNLRLVKGRARGPRNGRHPTVAEIPTVNKAATHTRITKVTFRNSFKDTPSKPLN
jgi:hypothetical protein